MKQFNSPGCGSSLTRDLSSVFTGGSIFNDNLKIIKTNQITGNELN